MTTHWLSILAPSVAEGNALAAQFSDNPLDASAFDYSTPVYPAGTQFTGGGAPMVPIVASNPPAMWYLGVSISATKYQLAEQMLPSVLASGFKIDMGLRVQTEPNWSQFIAAQGYVTP